MRTAEYVTESSLGDRVQVWLTEIRDRAAPHPDLRLDPGRCALLVIDMNRHFADFDGRCYLPAAGAITSRIAGLASAWRRVGSPVVFTRHGHEGPEDLGMLGRFFGDYIRYGEPESEIVDALTPEPGDTVLRKTTYDAFLHSPLEEQLREAGIEQVLVTGVLTHMCCETTARSAFCRGFEVYVAADATASHSEERHLQSLLAMADSVAVVVSVEEAMAHCANGG